MNKILALVLVVVLAGAAWFLVMRDRGVPTPVEAPPVAEAPAARPEPSTEPAPAPEPAPATPAPRAPAPRKAAPEPAAPVAPAAPTTATLVLDTDVPGASVFVNREYVGTTPLRVDGIEPGSKQLRLSADGYEGIERTVDLAAGDNPVTLRFREVRLNARVPVTHKHGMGSCEGTLIATVDGLAYETTNKNDAFRLNYGDVETFVVDYMDKNLRVKQRGGKTWNFTDKVADNADALFVFHREVEAARKKLADGYVAVK